MCISAFFVLIGCDNQQSGRKFQWEILEKLYIGIIFFQRCCRCSAKRTEYKKTYDINNINTFLFQESAAAVFVLRNGCRWEMFVSSVGTGNFMAFLKSGYLAPGIHQRCLVDFVKRFRLVLGMRHVQSFHLAKPCIFNNAIAVSSSNTTEQNSYFVEFAATKSNEDCKSFVSAVQLGLMNGTNHSLLTPIIIIISLASFQISCGKVQWTKDKGDGETRFAGKKPTWDLR